MWYKIKMPKLFTFCPTKAVHELRYLRSARLDLRHSIVGLGISYDPPLPAVGSKSRDKKSVVRPPVHCVSLPSCPFIVSHSVIPVQCVSLPPYQFIVSHFRHNSSLCLTSVIPAHCVSLPSHDSSFSFQSYVHCADPAFAKAVPIQVL